MAFKNPRSHLNDDRIDIHKEKNSHVNIQQTNIKMIQFISKIRNIYIVLNISY